MESKSSISTSLGLGLSLGLQVENTKEEEENDKEEMHQQPDRRPLLIFNHNDKDVGGSILEILREVKGGNNACELVIGHAHHESVVVTPNEILHEKETTLSLLSSTDDDTKEYDGSAISEANWTDRCLVNINESRGSNLSTRTTGYIIGSVREPCSQYLSLWPFGSNGYGDSQVVGKEFPAGQSSPYYDVTTAADNTNLQQWVQQPDVYGMINEQFHTSYGSGDDDIDDGVDCFVFVEVFQYSLVRCLRLYENQGGQVDWDGRMMSQILPVASQQEKMIMTKITEQQQQQQQQSDHSRRTTTTTLRGNFHRQLNMTNASTRIGRQTRAGKSVPINNPQVDHHATCETYFDEETSMILEEGPEKILFNKFGYQGCCSQEFDYGTWLFSPSKVDLDDLFIKHRTKGAFGDGVVNNMLTFLVASLVVLSFRIVPSLIRKRRQRKTGNRNTSTKQRSSSQEVDVADKLSCRWEDKLFQSQMLQPPSSC